MESLAFRARYNYSRSGAIELPIELRANAARSVRLRAKVDTGAAFCIFQRDYADLLGIDVETGEHVRVATATGHFDAYGHSVVLSCLEWEFETTVYFAAPANFRRNVVGRSGWLQRFRLALIDHDALLFLSAYDDA